MGKRRLLGMVRKLLWALLIVVYAMLALFGFLSGMLSEGFVGSVHPMAGLLADAIVWIGLIVSLAAVICPLVALGLKKRPILRAAVLALPFMLFVAQMVLSAVADCQ